MKPIYNKILPIKGFVAINLFGIIFARKGYRLGQVELNHERIHTQQMIEMLFVFFYLFYLIEWLIKLVYYRDFMKAYRSISFEREAYNFQRDLYYLKKRRAFAWRKWVRFKV